MTVLPRHKRVILWGLHGETGDSFQHIWRHYAHALEHAGKPWVWLPDTKLSRSHLVPGDLVFAVDVAAKSLGTPVAGVDYMLHNIPDTHPVRDGLEPERHIYLQVYTNDCADRGEAWGPVRRWDRNSRVLYQPWGTNLLPHEFGSIVWNPDSKTVPFVGSVWDGNGQGNLNEIRVLQNQMKRHGLTYEHHVGVSDDRNAQVVRESRFAPAVAGAWQVEHEYLPCRVFKNVSYGTLGVTNVPTFRALFGDASVVNADIGCLVEGTLGIHQDDWHELVAAQQEVVREHYTYATSLEMIGRAFDS